MFDFSFFQLDPKHPKRHLSRLETPFGVRSVYDSISYCTRCGSCQQACPTYLLTQEESFSPRGRNQAARLLAEGKIKTAENTLLLQEIAYSCLLCGRCTRACAGKIPTAEHMLELRRTLGSRVLPHSLQKALSCRGTHPSLFSKIVRIGLLLHRAKLLKFFAHVPGFAWLRHTAEMLPRRSPALFALLREQQISATPQKPTLIYLPSLEAEFLLPGLALKTLQLANQTHRSLLWTNTASGLFEYVYGDIRQARHLVKKLISRWQHDGDLPLLTDSVDVFLFLKRAPQLFGNFPHWHKKAEAFSKAIRFVTDLFPKPKNGKNTFHTARFATPVRLDHSALFVQEGAPFEQAEKTLKTLFKQNLVKCLYRDAGVPAFGYSFVRPEIAKRVCLDAVQSIARTQTGTVFTLSGLSALELNYYLKRFYPNAQADHIANLYG